MDVERPPRGRVRQFTLEEPAEISRRRCRQCSKSRTVTTRDGMPENTFCTECLHLILSKHDAEFQRHLPDG